VKLALTVMLAIKYLFTRSSGTVNYTSIICVGWNFFNSLLAIRITLDSISQFAAIL
jgi:hypothetical protein